MPDQITGLLSPFLRSRRLAAALPWLRSGRVLDVGCGVGELAKHKGPDSYLGIDRDQESIDIARARFPDHHFYTWEDLHTWDGFVDAEQSRPFAHVAMLAVIEHVPDPSAFLAQLTTWLAPHGDLVITTPHPRYRRLHEAGAAVGIFSREGADEHQGLIDEQRMRQLSAPVGLQLVEARRFLLHANQLFILRRLNARTQ